MKMDRVIQRMKEATLRWAGHQYYLLMTAILAVGLIVSMLWPESNMFARSGAVLVAVTAFLYFHDQRQHTSWWRSLQYRYEQDREVAKRPVKDAEEIATWMKNRGAEYDEIEAAIRDARVAVTPILRERGQKHRDNIKKAESALEAQGILILVGTLVWGFGDLVILGVLKC
ncbi:hypothetical protein [Pseudooctadecabacter jejudonensis]|uniref:SMODS and SLOG-associating 2TM effector domain-containing protein n=1 Tax=Pseudooctadecabacter jejudonensis TaxID=1391910 RepID=A0A1Y5RHC2_9RHOB|nr:hypothetical protein [Pseudooctadecabacter jejudonensis]SLN17340.1 hypothetical protein PSJ8397_00548 [Pseudooctadecabacter jejudonensis]